MSAKQGIDDATLYLEDLARPVATRRAWLLLLVDAAERAGLAPLSSIDIHRFAYFADCLAPVYGLLSPDGVVLQSDTGPRFPDLEWDIERLWVLGFVRRVQAPDVGVRFGIAEAGIGEIEHICTSPRSDRTYTFLCSLLTAIAESPRESAGSLVFEDLVFASPNVSVGSLIAYGDPSSLNASVEAARVFDAVHWPGVRLQRRDRLMLYIALLRRRLAEHVTEPAL